MKEGTETALYNQGYMDGFDDAEKDKDTPDYWTRLEHQYAGMAMQLNDDDYDITFEQSPVEVELVIKK